MQDFVGVGEHALLGSLLLETCRHTIVVDGI